MRTKFFHYIIFSFAIIGSLVLLNAVLAQGNGKLKNIQYPVKELGSCQSESACKVYCDKSENIQVCVDFAEKNNLMSKDEITKAKKFIAAGSKGPGGCQGKETCEKYCNDTIHIDECISFAEKNNLIPPEELAEAKQVQAAIRKGAKPPPCRGKKECDVYCDNPDNMDECITFGEAAGFIKGKELEDAKKMLTAVKKGIKPPPCRGKEACDLYCSDPNHMEACMTFAMEAGFMSEQEKTEAQRMLAVIKKGFKPPDCRGREECDVYCSQDEHFDECANFAEAAGFMSAEDAVMARKTRGKGPGDCKGKEECEAFCNNPENQETCFEFAQKHGLIPEEDLKKIEEGKREFKKSLEKMPAEVGQCLETLVGSEKMTKFKSGAAMPSREIGDQMRQCFEKFMPKPPEGEFGQAGPGGCQNPEECKIYCEVHPQECQNFMLPEGGRPDMPPGENGMRREMPSPVQGEGPEVEMMRERILQNTVMMVKDSLSRLTPEMKECVISKMGQDSFDKFYAGDFTGLTQEDSGRIQGIVGGCVGQFKPTAQQSQQEDFQRQPQQEKIQYQPPQTGERAVPCEGEDCPNSPPLFNQPLDRLPKQFIPETRSDFQHEDMADKKEPLEPLIGKDILSPPEETVRPPQEVKLPLLPPPAEEPGFSS